MKATWNQKLGQVACGVLVVALAVSASAQQRRDRDGNDRRYDRGRFDSRQVDRWSRQLVENLDRLHEDLLHERVDRRVINDAERAMEAAVHFQTVVRDDADHDHLRQDFRRMDRRLHDLLAQVEHSRSSGVRRAAARVEFADEQLHYHLSSPVAGDRDTFRELVERHAQLLARESRRLEQLTRQFYGRNEELHEVLRDFADRADHLYDSLRQDANWNHLRRDYDEMDRSWHVAVDHINRSNTGLWLRRQAQRVNEVHNQLHDVLDRDGRHEVSHRPDDNRQPRPRIQFEIPGIGRVQF